MKLTPELIEAAAQYINPATRDRELDLRGYKLTAIENLGATLDQFDCIDLSDNDIKKLDGFPLLPRLKKLLLNNNRISRISDTLAESVPNLETLVLTNNNILELGDIDALGSFDRLHSVSLLTNPVVSKRYYRLYVIHKLPHLTLLDFSKVKLKERAQADNLFSGSLGRQLHTEISVKSNTFTPGVTDLSDRLVHTPADVEAIKTAISRAQTLEEIERLNQLLKSGYIPGKSDTTPTNSSANQQQEMEEDDNDSSEQVDSVNGQ